MIDKLAYSSASGMEAPVIFDDGKSLVKRAALLPEVERFAGTIDKNPKFLWVLAHAIGAFEAYGANRNGDGTNYSALNNVPKDWTGEPSIDKIIARDWHYGWPTYYNAYVYANHINKDPAKSVGSVEFVCWNEEMLRVELILKIDKDRARKFGGGWAVDRVDSGGNADVSMGMRVPFDLSNREIDWDKYNRAVATYDPGLHKTRGHAVLLYHKKDPIPGLSITRNDYTDEVKLSMNKVYPDGSKTFVWNTFPRFFDISLVFVGAERPAKIMHKFASQCKISGIKCATCRGKNCSMKVVTPGAYLPDLVGDDMSKTAAVDKSALEGKVGRLLKKSEIDKETPSNFEEASVAAMADREEDLPKDVLDRLGKAPIGEGLSTPTLLGIKLKPREFQRIVLIHSGREDLADSLDGAGTVFRRGLPAPTISPCINHGSFSSALAKLLAPLMGLRSSFGPALRGRITIIMKKQEPSQDLVEKSSPVLDKLSAAYTAYEKDIYENFEKEAQLVCHQNMVVRDALFGSGMLKEGGTLIDEFTLEYMGAKR